MTMLERYIALSVVRATGMALFVLMSILFFLDVSHEIEQVGRGTFQSKDAFVLATLTAPRYVFEVFPIAALLGSLIGLGSLANHGELVAMRSAGFSLSNVLIAVLKIGLAMMILIFLVGELLAPAGEEQGQKIRAQKLFNQITMKSEYGFWAKDANAFINVRRILPGGRLEDIYIYELTDDRRLALATHADFAEFRDEHWELGSLRQTRILEDGVEPRFLETAKWDSLLDPGLLQVIVVRPTMLPVWGLHRYIRFLTENGQEARAFKVAFWTKVTTPIATLVMLLLAVPVVLGTSRSINIGQRIFFGAILGSVFFLLTRAFSYGALVFDIAPFIAGIIPTLTFLILGGFLLRRAR